MPVRSNGGVFNDQMMTGSLRHYVVQGADFSGALDQYGKPVPGSAAEVIFTTISENGFINIMNPTQFNISFALEQNRSKWDENSLNEAIQALGNDVGVDHVDCTLCSVNEVPYIWDLGSTGISFLDLDDTPSTYSGAMGYAVTVNNAQNGLVFTPVVKDSFKTIAVPSQPTITASGSDTLNLVAGTNVSITTNAGTKTIQISANDTTLSEFIPIAAPFNLVAGNGYLVTNSGTVTLPATTGLLVGASVEIGKRVSQTVTVVVNNISSDIINTDMGSDTAIDLDVTAILIFIYDGSAWNLQIGSTN